MGAGCPPDVREEKLEPNSIFRPLEDSSNTPPPWTVKDDVKYPTPEGGADSSRLAAAKQQEYDRERCQIWKDEIDKLLLFAGLFSAIVTGFTIESSKRLEADPQEATAAALLVVLRQLDSIARQNSTALPALISNPVDPFQVPPYAVHVNVCWYLSLILSLTAVLVGILCLQWLREHLKSSTASTDPDLIAPSFVLRSLRVQLLNSWGIPILVASLPILLLVSLCLFFAGLWILLWNINKTVAIAASGAISVTVFILLATSILPVLRHRCAFRSPQARLFQWFGYYMQRAARVCMWVCICLVAFGLWLASLGPSMAIITVGPVGIVLHRICMWLVAYLFPGATQSTTMETDSAAGEASKGKTLRNSMISPQAQWCPKSVKRLIGKAIQIAAWEPRPPEDWLSFDERTADEECNREDSSMIYWECFTTTLFRDPEAMLALVHRIEKSVLPERKAKVVVEQMLALLCKGDYNAWLPWRSRWPSSLLLEPQILDTTLGLALCMAYAAKTHPLSLLRLLSRRIECVLKLTSSRALDRHSLHCALLEDLLRDLGWGSDPSGRENILGLHAAVSKLPQELAVQACEALWQALTQRETSYGEIGLRVETMIHLQPDFGARNRQEVSTAIEDFNHRLTEYSLEGSAEQSALFVKNIEAYLRYSSWRVQLEHGVPRWISIWFGGSLLEWFQGTGSSFIPLAQKINAEKSKLKNKESFVLGLLIAISGSQWESFARNTFGIEPISSQQVGEEAVAERATV